MIERFTRSYSLGLDVTADGRTVEGRIVPYDTPAPIHDEEGDYDEVFTATSLLGMIQGVAARGGRWSHIDFNLDHRQSLDHRIGFATDVRSEADGAYATFELYDGADLPKVRSMLQASHRGLSIEFGAAKSRRRDDGVVERLGVHIFSVAATPTPAYAGAGILAVREDALDPLPPPTPVLDEMLARWGFDLTSSSTDEA